MEKVLHLSCEIVSNLSKRKKSREGTWLSSTSGSSDPSNFHISKYAKNLFMKKEIEKMPFCYAIDNNDDIRTEENKNSENEAETNELLKFFKSEKCYIFGAAKCLCFNWCGHQCSCERFYSSLGLKQKCVVYST